MGSCILVVSEKRLHELFDIVHDESEFAEYYAVLNEDGEYDIYIHDKNWNLGVLPRLLRELLKLAGGIEGVKVHDPGYPKIKPKVLLLDD